MMIIDSPEAVDVLEPITQEIRLVDMRASNIENSIRDKTSIEISLKHLQRNIETEEEAPAIKPSYLFFPEGEHPNPAMDEAHHEGLYENDPWMYLEERQSDRSRYGAI